MPESPRLEAEKVVQGEEETGQELSEGTPGRSRSGGLTPLWLTPSWECPWGREEHWDRRGRGAVPGGVARVGPPLMKNYRNPIK